MDYLILIITFVIITQILIKKTFYWKTIVKYLWKQIYQISDLMASEIKSGSNEILYIKKYKKTLGIRGNVINSILDYVNYIKKQKSEEDEDIEEETFGYGRYDFNTILMMAKTNLGTFKKFK